MNPIPFDTLLKKVKTLKEKGVNWHFHMVGPTCIFNQAKDVFEIVVEIESTGETICSHFEDKPLDQTHQLAELAYGAGFLEKASTNKGAEAVGEDADDRESFLKIMNQAKACCEAATAWHNHHLPPQCRFNPRKGRHCIVFENEASGEPLYAYYQDDPVSDLARLERLFFKK